MSKYSENYKKTTDGYNKIMLCIDTAVVLPQLGCIPNIVDNWVDLVELYCNQVAQDKKDRHRKKNSNQLAEVAKGMFENLKARYQYALQVLSPKDYEGNFSPVKVKTIQEMISGETEQPQYVIIQEDEEDGDDEE